MSSKNYYGLVFKFHQRLGIQRVVINLKERNVGTNEKRPKQGLASVKDLTVKLHEGRDSTYHRVDYIWMKKKFRLPNDLTWRYVIKKVIKKII